MASPNTAGAFRVGDKITIRRRGRRGIYIAEYSFLGQHQRRTLGTTNATIARQRAVLLASELLRGEHRASATPVSIADAVREFLESKTGEGRKPKTIVKYTGWLEDFRDYARERHAARLDEVNPQLYDQYRIARKASYAPKSLHTGLVIVKQFMNWVSGAGRDYLVKNPLRHFRLTKPYVERQYAPTPDEVAAILNKATGYRRVALAVAAYSGVRAEELRMLRPRGVDVKGGWLKVEPHSGWTPKNGRARKIPLHPTLIQILRLMPQRDCPTFFTSPPTPADPAGKRPMNVKCLNQYLQRLAGELGYEVGRADRGITLHGLRHFFETACVNSRVPQVVVDAWMGHSGGGHMVNIYYGHSDEKHREFMNSVNFPAIEAARGEKQ